MTIVRTLLERLGRRASPEDPRYPLTSATLLEHFGGSPVHAGVSVSEISALNYSAVYRAISLVAGSIAPLPLKVYRERAGTKEQIEGPFFFAQEPYPDRTPFEFWELVYSHLLLWGNAYLLKIRNETGTGILRLLPLPPSVVTVEKGMPTGLNPSGKTYLVDAGGVRSRYTPWELLHLPGLGYDGLVGLSPIRLMRQAVGLALAAEEFGARFFGSGALLGGILRTDQEVPEEAAETLKKRWRQKMAGIAHAHEVAVLDRGASFERIGIPPEDGQFLQTRVFQTQEIARYYGVPLHLLMDAGATSNWGTGVEQHGTQFIRYTLRPWMARVEQKVSLHLLPRGQFAKFDESDLMRGSAMERANFYAAGLRDGWLTLDEVRDWEGLEPLETVAAPAADAPPAPPLPAPDELEEVA